MEYTRLFPAQKSQLINTNKDIYGSFAEIGAGQEVARHFFKAGYASQTVAKTMSAYDMTFSDAIYGKGQRYVSQQRLEKMLEHEFNLLKDRLPSEGRKFFAFANTVATSSHDDTANCHAWMGIRYQTEVDGPTEDIVLHVKMKDRLRLQQHDALGKLGVNLLFATFNYQNNEHFFVRSLMDNLSTDRLEIDFIQRFTASHNESERSCAICPTGLNNQRLSLELVLQGISSAVMFNPKGESLAAADCLYGRPVVVQRGYFRPITKTNVTILERSLADVKSKLPKDAKNPREFLEFTVDLDTTGEGIDLTDSLHKIETLTTAGYHVLVSNFPLFYQLKQYLRKCTDKSIYLVIGASHLEKLFDEKYYKHLEGGLLQAFGQMFDDQTSILVYPFKDEKVCLTSDAFTPSKKFAGVYTFLRDNERLRDIMDCESVDSSVQTLQVREWLSNKDERWKEHVPEEISKLITDKNLFGQ